MEIPVNTDPIIEPRINASTKSSPARKKQETIAIWKDYREGICFLTGLIVGIAICIAYFQYEYAELVDDANWLKRTNEEMTWRTERIKQDILTNSGQLAEYEKKSEKFVNDLSDRIKNRKAKVVEN